MIGHGYGVKCWITNEPWMDAYQVRMGALAGSRALHASGVDDRGHIIWTEHDDGEQVEPWLVIGEGELEAIARAVGERTQTNDETRAALKDTREIRDRLLKLVEEGWHL